MKGLHHMHLRKRDAAKHEPFPARSWRLRALDRFVLAVGIVGPLMTIPQILKIYVLHSASGVSLLTWGMYAVTDVPWIIYGLAHREKPITITYVLWCLMNSTVAIGAIIYGGASL